MTPDMLQKLDGRDPIGVEAGDEVTNVVQEHNAVGGTDRPVDAQG